MKRIQPTTKRLPRGLSSTANWTNAAVPLLELLRENDFNSVGEARKSSGLRPREFDAAVKALEKKRLIERTNGKTLTGKVRPERLQIRANFGYVAAVDVGGTNLRLVIADMTGAIVGKWTGSTVDASSPSKVVQLIQTGVKHIVQEAGVREDALLAVSAGVAGVTDSKRGVVLLTSYLGGWKDVPLGTMLTESLSVPAVIENDVRLGAVGERWKGSARGLDNFVFLAIGTGIAAGICVNGELLHGPEFAAGEVGYLVVPGTPAASDAAAVWRSDGGLERNGHFRPSAGRRRVCAASSGQNGEDSCARGVQHFGSAELSALYSRRRGGHERNPA